MLLTSFQIKIFFFFVLELTCVRKLLHMRCNERKVFPYPYKKKLWHARIHERNKNVAPKCIRGLERFFSDILKFIIKKNAKNNNNKVSLLLRLSLLLDVARALRLFPQ